MFYLCICLCLCVCDCRGKGERGHEILWNRSSGLGAGVGSGCEEQGGGEMGWGLELPDICAGTEVCFSRVAASDLFLTTEIFLLPF